MIHTKEASKPGAEAGKTLVTPANPTKPAPGDAVDQKAANGPAPAVADNPVEKKA